MQTFWKPADSLTVLSLSLLPPGDTFICFSSPLNSPRYAVPPLNSSEEEIREALGRWGYPDFRPGQLEAVKRILAGLSKKTTFCMKVFISIISGKSTLVLLATGTG